MILQQIKKLYSDEHNNNAINIINEIEQIYNRTNLPLNKIINYLYSKCTSKTNRKIFAVLEQNYPLYEELTENDINKILNKPDNTIEENNIKQEQEIKNTTNTKKDLTFKKRTKVKKDVNFLTSEK